MGRQKYVCPLLCKPWLSMTKKKICLRSFHRTSITSLSIISHSNTSLPADYEEIIDTSMIWQGWHFRFEGYSSLLRMSTTSSFGLLDFVFFTGVLAWLGPVNSHKSIRSAAEIRGDTSAFRSSNLIESLDFKRRKLTLEVIELETWCSLKLLLIWQPQSVTTQIDRNKSFPYNSDLIWVKLSIQKSSRAVPNTCLLVTALHSVEVAKKENCLTIHTNYFSLWLVNELFTVAEGVTKLTECFSASEIK